MTLRIALMILLCMGTSYTETLRSYLDKKGLSYSLAIFQSYNKTDNVEYGRHASDKGEVSSRGIDASVNYSWRNLEAKLRVSNAEDVSTEYTSRINYALVQWSTYVRGLEVITSLGRDTVFSPVSIDSYTSPSALGLVSAPIGTADYLDREKEFIEGLSLGMRKQFRTNSVSFSLGMAKSNADVYLTNRSRELSIPNPISPRLPDIPGSLSIEVETHKYTSARYMKASYLSSNLDVYLSYGEIDLGLAGTVITPFSSTFIPTLGDLSVTLGLVSAEYRLTPKWRVAGEYSRTVGKVTSSYYNIDGVAQSYHARVETVVQGKYLVIIGASRVLPSFAEKDYNPTALDTFMGVSRGLGKYITVVTDIHYVRGRLGLTKANGENNWTMFGLSLVLDI